MFLRINSFIMFFVIMIGVSTGIAQAECITSGNDTICYHYYGYTYIYNIYNYKYNAKYNYKYHYWQLRDDRYDSINTSINNLVNRSNNLSTSIADMGGVSGAQLINENLANAQSLIDDLINNKYPDFSEKAFDMNIDLEDYKDRQNSDMAVWRGHLGGAVSAHKAQWLSSVKAEAQRAYQALTGGLSREMLATGPGCAFPLGHPDYCFSCGPCDEGEGGCHFDRQCKPGLVCDTIDYAISHGRNRESATFKCINPAAASAASETDLWDLVTARYEAQAKSIPLIFGGDNTNTILECLVHKKGRLVKTSDNYHTCLSYF